MVQAQAQAQRQHTISHTESLELVRCLLRVSVFHISYLRGLFPDDYFRGVDMRNLDGMNIKMLLPACEESRRLIDWVEGGVYDAIRRGYLKTLFFGIATDPDGTKLLEEYIFNFNYAGADGPVSMDLAQRKNGTGKKLHSSNDGTQKGETSVEAVKYQVTRLMRMLVQICQTLDKVPQERYLFMKLMYYDEAPEDYEPPYFVPVEGDACVGHFERKPFSMSVGNVNTCHHGVAMKVKSTLDCCDEGEEGEMAETDIVASAAAPSTQLGTDNDCDMDEVAVATRAPETVQEESIPEEQFEMVRDYVVQSFQMYSQLEMADAMGALMSVPPAALEIAFKRLEDEGVITKDANLYETYRPANKKQPQEPAVARKEQAAARKGTRGKGSKADREAVAAAAEAQKMMGRLAVGADDVCGERDQVGKTAAELSSQQAGVQTTGSDMTGDGVAAAGDAGGDDVTGQDTGNGKGVFFDAGQQSQAAGKGSRVRKASYVADPIYQAHQPSAKKTRRQTAHAPPAVGKAATRARK